ncbi:jg20941 [Pararge aegeria aegeria]|uniref:Jg20941 protein n=1 Tax=Pararge aegeria aegeria TaxID=348720 RepID=A0A8S4QPC5_9NEOP|nr:jg20941 [Pararge aegeria aegeria]
MMIHNKFHFNDGNSCRLYLLANKSKLVAVIIINNAAFTRRRTKYKNIFAKNTVHYLAPKQIPSILVQHHPPLINLPVGPGIIIGETVIEHRSTTLLQCWPTTEHGSPPNKRRG